METEIRTKNGVVVYSYPNAALHGFFLSLFVRAGSIFETEETQGITHFFEHISIRNINEMTGGKLYAMLDRLGLEFNATTYNEMVQFYVSGASAHFAEGAEVLTMILSEIRLPKREIDLERARIKAEIREGDEKNTLANFTAAEMYPESTLRFPIVGTTKTVNAVTGRALEEYRKSILTPENMFFYATGAFTPEDIAGLARRIEGYELRTAKKRENFAPVPLSFGKRDAAVAIKSADYTVMRFNFDLDMTKISEAESDLLYDLLLSGYNSRFFIEMSEKRGLFYDISGSLDRYRNIGCFYFYYELKAKDVIDAAKITVDLLREVKREPVKPEEILRASYVDNAMMLYDDPRELGFTFAYDAHIMECPYRSLADRREAYRSITPERLLEVARILFTADNLTLTMKGNKKKTDLSKLREILKEIDN